jgi:hypothetical protein
VHAHRLELNGDPLLTLEVHGVEELRLHGALFHRAGELEHAVGQGGFAVVDVGDDAEIAGVGLVH